MDKKEENVFLTEKENDIRFKLLERQISELNNTIVILQERITSLERSNYRYSRTPSFLTGDPFMFLPEQG